jgi:hypothetical protein
MRFNRPAAPILALAIFFAMLSPAASASDLLGDEGGQGPARRWVPSLSLEAGVLGQDLKAVVQSGQREDTPQDGDTRTVFPTLGARIALATPSLVDLSGVMEGPSTLRLYAHGGISYSIDKVTSITREGTVGPFKSRAAGGVDQGLDSNELAEVFSGQGAEVSSETQPLLLTAGLGVDFAFTIFDRLLHLKPSVEYRREELDYSAFASDVLPNGTNPNPGRCPCAGLRLRADEHQISHGIGPGLELELEAVRAEDFLLSIYAVAIGYRNLGELTQRWTKTGTYDDGVTPGDVTGKVEIPDWSVRLGVGVRVSWLPSSM